MTMIYTTDQWIFFFFIYCFFGWIWESSFVSIRTKKLTNRGFMRGPFIPIYGCGNIRRMEDVKKLLYAGCIEVILNGSKPETIDLLKEAFL